MKNNYFKLLLIEIGLMLFSFFYLFINKSFNYLIYLGLLVIICGLIWKFVKIEKRVERFNNELLLIIVISLIFYYVVTYIIGFFSGFFYSTYSKSIIGILRNILSATVLFFTLEVMRERIIKQGEKYKSIVVITVFVFTLLELPSVFSFGTIDNGISALDAIVSVLVPIFSKNIFLTYAVYKSNKMSSLTYQLLITIPTYIVPILPNLGDYFTTIINLTLPLFVLLLCVNITITKREKVKESRTLKSESIKNNIIIVFLISIMVLMVYLTCGLFRFYALAIGSESMQGSINKGDIVIIDKHHKNIKKGEVIAFKQDNKTIVHRVKEVIDQENGLYKTKGDNNNAEDAWIVEEKNIVGRIRLKIKYLGWPTVALSELIAK